LVVWAITVTIQLTSSSNGLRQFARFLQSNAKTRAN